MQRGRLRPTVAREANEQTKIKNMLGHETEAEERTKVIEIIAESQQFGDWVYQKCKAGTRKLGTD